MLNNLITNVFAIMGLFALVVYIYDYFFPSKPAFTSQKEFNKWLELNADQYKKIMGEARSEFVKELKGTLDNRDKRLTEIMEEAEKQIRKEIAAYKDNVDNGGAQLTAEAMTTFNFLIITMRQYNPGFMPDLPTDPALLNQTLMQIYFKLNEKSQSRVVPKA